MRHTPCGCCPPACVAEYFDYLAGSSKYASASRFLLAQNMLCTNQTPGMIQEGGRNPLLGRFKGDCKGGAPARIQRSDSRGKRRNNETDETCRLRRGEGCGVCSDANPPFAVFFLPPAAFSLLRKEKAAESFPAPFARIRRHPSGDESRVLRARKPPAFSGCGPSAPAARLASSGRKRASPFG